MCIGIVSTGIDSTDSTISLSVLSDTDIKAALYHDLNWVMLCSSVLFMFVFNLFDFYQQVCPWNNHSSNIKYKTQWIKGPETTDVRVQTPVISLFIIRGIDDFVSYLYKFDSKVELLLM